MNVLLQQHTRACKISLSMHTSSLNLSTALSRGRISSDMMSSGRHGCGWKRERKSTHMFSCSSNACSSVGLVRSNQHGWRWRTARRGHVCCAVESPRQPIVGPALPPHLTPSIKKKPVAGPPPPPPTPTSSSTPAGPSQNQSPAASTTASSVNLNLNAPSSPRKEAQQAAKDLTAVYDHLIQVFRERNRDDWKRLIVMSKQWERHSTGVLNRVKELADVEEDVEVKLQIRKFYRSLQNVQLEVQRYNKVLGKFLEASEEEWEAVVAVYRTDLQAPFFDHMEVLIAAAADDPQKQEELIQMNTKLLALVSAHDSVASQTELLERAAGSLDELLTTSTSMQDMDAKLSELANQGRIDPAFLHITAKAYGNAKDRTMEKEEVKDAMFRMYLQARNVYQQKQPRAERILKYLIRIDDPKTRWEELDKAVTPGPEIKNNPNYTHDYLWATPHELFELADSVCQAYEVMRDQARGRLRIRNFAVTPRKVQVLKQIRDQLKARYL